MHDLPSELLLELVYSQFFLILRSDVVPTVIEEAETSFLEPHNVAPIQQAICAPDQVSPTRIGYTSKRRACKEPSKPAWRNDVAAGTEHLA